MTPQRRSGGAAAGMPPAEPGVRYFAVWLSTRSHPSGNPWVWSAACDSPVEAKRIAESHVRGVNPSASMAATVGLEGEFAEVLAWYPERIAGVIRRAGELMDALGEEE